ncbi:MAG: glycosyltransferase family 2 protein [Proteobacteria bacterium]|nr:glycosyltransferase family 2 protein [Pseudomonadota bacterium]
MAFSLQTPGATDLVLSVTIVVCTYRRPSTLEQCLLSVKRLDRSPSHVVVVDNAPQSHAAQLIAEKFGVDYRVAPLRGLSRARNAGSRSCPSDIIAYIDDDMILHPQWLSALISEFSDERTVCVTGPVIALDYTNASAEKLHDVLLNKPWGAQGFKVSQGSPSWFERANFGGVGDGNFALRRSVFDWWVGFDETIGRGMPIDIGEEHYAFFQMIEKGYTIAYAPEAIVFHPNHLNDHTQALHNLAQDFAYAGLLGIRHPRYIPRICRFLVEGFVGKHRDWRTWSDGQMRTRVSFFDAFGAFGHAVSLLLKTYRLS